MNAEPAVTERLSEIRDRLAHAWLNKQWSTSAEIVDELFAEAQRVTAEKEWYERKAREAGTIAWELDLGRKRVLDTMTARNVVNQIADYYMRRIPSDDWVTVRQATNDELDSWVAALLRDKFQTNE